MKRFFRRVHLWLSLPFGLFITMICFSGAMLVFEKEIMEYSNRRLYYVERVGDKVLPLHELAERVTGVLPDGVRVTGITTYSNPERTYQVSLSKPRRASIYIDPYSGEITGKYERNAFFATMFKMHRWLMGSARAKDGSMGLGKLLVGISTIMFAAALISGVILWWPRNKALLKKRFSINLRKGWKRFWYDLHVAGGIYALVFLLAMALTGLTWSFQWYRNGVYSLFGVETTQGGKPSKSASTEQEGLYAHWQTVHDELTTRNPNYKQVSIREGNASVSFAHWGNQRASDKYTFDSKNGEITKTVAYEKAPKSDKIRGWIYSIHVGSWGGQLTRILTFFAALLGASLPMTGYYLWIKRVWKK